VLFYDPETGNVVHGHCCEVASGEEMPSREELERIAVTHAQRHARRDRPFDAKRVAIHHVDAAQFRMDRLYRMDPVKRELVEVHAG
jgi:hypothetical protein